MPSGPRNGPIFMLKCDICKRGNRGHYVSRYVEDKVVTACDDCWYGPKKGKSDDDKFEELQTPFWKMIGAKPKPEEVELDRYLKHRGMSYGDWRRERDYGATHPSAFPEFERHLNKHGTKNAPDPSFGKDSQRPK